MIPDSTPSEPKRQKEIEMTQKDLRKQAREVLSAWLKNGTGSLEMANMAIAILHAPQFKGE